MLTELLLPIATTDFQKAKSEPVDGMPLPLEDSLTYLEEFTLKKQDMLLLRILGLQDQMLLWSVFRKMIPMRAAHITAGIQGYCSITAPVSMK